MKFDFDFVLTPTQQDVADQILAHIAAGVQHIILDAPTGSGKSIIAGYVAKEYKKRVDARACIITKSINLQNQYLRDFKTIADLRGKLNYKCTFDEAETYGSSFCFTSREKDCARHCSYVRARKAWMDKSDVRMSNFTMMIRACATICMKPTNFVPFMIIDECHDLPTAILENTELVFTNSVIKTSIETAPDKTVFTNYVDKIKKLIDVPLGSIYVPTEKDKKILKPIWGFFHGKYDEYEAEAKRIKGAKSTDELTSEQRRKIANAIESKHEVGEMADMIDLLINSRKASKFVRTDKGLKAIFSGDVSNFAIFRKGTQFLHMSATPCDIEKYKDDLRLGDSVELVTMASTFDVSNRPVYYINHSKIDKIDHKLASDLDTIISEYPVRGIIHTSSFERATALVALSKHSGRMVIPRGKDEITKAMRSPRKDLIIVSPSLATGYDFKDDLCRFQIILKVPYKPVEDVWMKAIYTHNRQFYYNMALTELVQMCGRGVRNENDYCDTYIMDSRFGGILHYQKDIVPKWFLEAVHIV